MVPSITLPTEPHSSSSSSSSLSLSSPSSLSPVLEEKMHEIGEKEYVCQTESGSPLELPPFDTPRLAAQGSTRNSIPGITLPAHSSSSSSLSPIIGGRKEADEKEPVTPALGSQSFARSSTPRHFLPSSFTPRSATSKSTFRSGKKNKHLPASHAFIESAISKLAYCPPLGFAPDAVEIRFNEYLERLAFEVLNEKGTDFEVLPEIRTRLHREMVSQFLQPIYQVIQKVYDGCEKEIETSNNKEISLKLQLFDCLKKFVDANASFTHFFQALASLEKKNSPFKTVYHELLRRIHSTPMVAECFLKVLRHHAPAENSSWDAKIHDKVLHCIRSCDLRSLYYLYPCHDRITALFHGQDFTQIRRCLVDDDGSLAFDELYINDARFEPPEKSRGTAQYVDVFYPALFTAIDSAAHLGAGSTSRNLIADQVNHFLNGKEVDHIAGKVTRITSNSMWSIFNNDVMKKAFARSRRIGCVKATNSLTTLQLYVTGEAYSAVHRKELIAGKFYRFTHDGPVRVDQENWIMRVWSNARFEMIKGKWRIGVTFSAPTYSCKATKEERQEATDLLRRPLFLEGLDGPHYQSPKQDTPLSGKGKEPVEKS